ESYGTEKSHLRTDEDEARAALKALRMLLKRRGIVFDPPWRDCSEFQSHWMAEGARGSGSWPGRRDITAKASRPIQNQPEEAEARPFLAELTEGISPHGELGWTALADHTSQPRQRFRSASTPVDYKDVGNRC